MNSIKKLSIVIPVYNERDNIRDILRAVEESDISPITKEVILVDDGSTDGSREVLAAIEKEGRHRVFYHPKNRGKGAALKTGFASAAGDWVLIQDADLEYDPQDYRALLKPVLSGDAEIVFGSRNLISNNVPFSAIYFHGGRITTLIFNALFGTRFSDIHTCYKLFPRRAVPDLLRQPSDDFVFDAVELTWVLARMGRIIEVPIRYRARGRRQGKKLNWRHGVRSVAAMLKMRFRLDGMIAWLRYRRAAQMFSGRETVLDIGCGPEFRFLRYIRDRITVGYGADRRVENGQDGNIKLICHDIDRVPVLPLDGGSVDAVVMLAVLEHFSNPEKALAEASRVLRRGGLLYLTTPTPPAKPVLEFLAFRLGWIDAEEIREHKRYFSKKTLLAALGNEGFSVERHEFFEFGFNQLLIARKP